MKCGQHAIHFHGLPTYPKGCSLILRCSISEAVAASFVALEIARALVRSYFFSQLVLCSILSTINKSCFQGRLKMEVT